MLTPAMNVKSLMTSENSRVNRVERKADRFKFQTISHNLFFNLMFLLYPFIVLIALGMNAVHITLDKRMNFSGNESGKYETVS